MLPMMPMVIFPGFARLQPHGASRGFAAYVILPGTRGVSRGQVKDFPVLTPHVFDSRLNILPFEEGPHVNVLRSNLNVFF
jgi:hypothetical protein